MKSLITTIVLCLLIGSAAADDLYHVRIDSPQDAAELRQIGVDPLMQLVDGYLILVSSEASQRLEQSPLAFEQIASDVQRADLAFDNRRDRKNVGRLELLYEAGDVRLFRVEGVESRVSDVADDIMPVGDQRPDIFYAKTPAALLGTSAMALDLQTLIAGVNVDSLTNYLTMLQSFQPRLAGSATGRLARDWAYAKFVEFGYDSVYIDTFEASLSGTLTECYNVIAYKAGTVYPGHKTVVGAHYDAVAVSPGADDNGSGSVGVLEIARLLVEVETSTAFEFCLYDAEEFGLFGSWHHVTEAIDTDDSISFMVNMDMIGFYQNTTSAVVYYGIDMSVANLWAQLADSLLGMTTYFEGVSSGSDHYPYSQRGIPVVFAAEYVWSAVYHTANDSMSYMDMDYVGDMVRASLATAYSGAQSYVPAPVLIFSFPSGLPTIIAPDAEIILNVDIIEAWGGQIIADSYDLLYSVDNGPVVNLPLVSLGGGQYSVTLPAIDCGSTLYYSFQATEMSTGLYEYPAAGHEPIFSPIATGTTVAFEDNFETVTGWSAGGSAIDGVWERGIPAGGGLRGDPPTDYDGSGYCYLTDNVAGNSDVDGGTTYLISPQIDASGGDARITYARWFNNAAGAAPYEDSMRVLISNNGGVAWTMVEVVGPAGLQVAGGWYLHSFFISDFVAPTNRMRLKVEVDDILNGSVVEAGFDAFSVTRYDCSLGCCEGLTGNVDNDSENIVDIGDLTALIGYLFIPPFVVPDCLDEANADGVGEVDIGDLTALINYLFITYIDPVPCP